MRFAWSLVIYLLAPHVAARVCDVTGKEAPSVVTLLVSPNTPTNAIVLSPDCTVKEFTPSSPGSLEIRDAGVQQVESVPDVENLILSGNRITSGNFAKGNSISLLSLNDNKISSLDGFAFPKSLQILYLSSNQLERILPGQIQDGLMSLSLSGNRIASVSDVALPSSVKSLSLSENKFSSLNFEVPSQLDSLDMSSNVIGSLKGIIWGDKLSEFSCIGCQLTSITGVRFSSNLKRLSLDLNAISVFEVCRSDLPTLQAMTFPKLKVNQPKCNDTTATRVLLPSNGIPACVISDERFQQKYVRGGGLDTTISTETNSPTPAPSNSPSIKDSTPSPDETSSSSPPMNPKNGTDQVQSGSLDTTGFEWSITPEPSRTENAGSAPLDQSNSSDQHFPAQSPSGNASGSANDTRDYSTLIMVLISAACVIGCGIIWIFVRRGNKQQRGANGSPGFELARGAPSEANTAKTTSSRLSSNDPLNDSDLLMLRIDNSEVSVLQVLSRGGNGVVHLARYRGQYVAAKQLLPELARDATILGGFVDEIRLSAKLQHPQIVEFIGISYNSLRDMTVIMEYMAGGDLYTALRDAGPQSHPSQWTEYSPKLKPKRAIAIDVAQAMVYLHSFQPPIIHRDLKARNVLLGEESNAKLSDFGTSRAVPSSSTTMTGEIGTLAWIAPEILRGERYSEKADVYSFGVLLVEMDRCSHPYAAENASSSEASMASTQIALLVSAGKLKPKMTAMSPRRLRDLVVRCLDYYPVGRPTFIELVNELRKV